MPRRKFVLQRHSNFVRLFIKVSNRLSKMNELKLFKNTKSLLGKSRKKIEKVLDKYLNLDRNGFDSPYDRSNREEQLLDEHSVNGFLLCEQWLKIVDYNKTFNTRRTSYRYKHIVEKWADFYISNGIFIVAALANKIEIERCKWGLNCYLKVSEKSVKPFEKSYLRKALPESTPKPIYLFAPDYFVKKAEKSDN